MRLFSVCVVLSLLPVLGCQSSGPSGSSVAPDSAGVREVTPRRLPLAAPLNRRDIEISGLAWYGDTLVVLPQYPARGSQEPARQLYGLPRSALQKAVSDSTVPPLDPVPIPLEATGISENTAAYEGGEAIAFEDDRVYVVLEGKAEGEGMRGHLLRGRVAPGLRRIRIRGTGGQSLPQQVQLPNMSYEALTLRGDTVVALFEANGARVNPTPRAYRFGAQLRALGPLSFPNLEYRLTDATRLDRKHRFWVINYFYPDERDVLEPGPDSLALRYGEGATHRTSEVVERLVEYRYTAHGIRRTDRAPIWFELGGGTGRNWEGLVRFEQGFLVATDRFPATILAYVPAPRQ